MFDAFYEIAVRTSCANNIELGLRMRESDESRYKFICPILEKLPFPQVPEHLKREKSMTKSVQLRERGNQFFVKNFISSALTYYTESLAYAPPDSEAQSLAYSNRSAVHMRMDNLFECIDDVKHSLLAGCPLNVQYKLYQRQGYCLKMMYKFDEAMNSFTQSISSLAEYNGLDEGSKKKMHDELMKEIESCKSQVDIDLSGFTLNNPVTTHKNVPSLSYGRNGTFPCASDSIAMSFNQEMDRHIVATRDIEPGDVLMIEEPHAAALHSNNLYTHCTCCLRRSMCLQPCRHCTWAMYCSEGCRAKDAKQHEIECSVMPTLLAWNIDELSFIIFKVLTATGISVIHEYLHSNKSQANDPMTDGFTEGQYRSTDFHTLYHLARNSEMRTASDLTKRAICAWCLVKCLGDLIPDAKLFGTLFVRLFQIMSCNAFNVSEIVKDISDTEQEHDVGGGIYPTTSLFSHSCNPKCSLVNFNSSKVVFVNQPIKKGSVVSISYGWIFTETAKAKRQERCMTRYQFKCKCEACEGDWPLLVSVYLPWEPYIFRQRKDKEVWTQSKKKVEDLFNKVTCYLELSHSEAVRVMRHIKIMTELGLIKNFEYHVHVTALDHFFARQGSRFYKLAGVS